MFFLENHHLGEMLILAFLLNSMDESIMHSAFNDRHYRHAAFFPHVLVNAVVRFLFGF